MGHSEYDPAFAERRPWNAGRKLGAKRALKPQQVWAIRFWLDRERRLRDRALFDLAIDSKLRGCDVVKVRIGDLVTGGVVRNRAIVIQQKTSKPVQFELLEPARASILAWLERRGGSLEDYAFPSRTDHADHLSTRQFARLVDEWVTGVGLAPRGLRHPFASPNEGLDHLQGDRQPARGADPARPYQDREHGPLPWCRCRGCSDIGGRNRGLTIPRTWALADVRRSCPQGWKADVARMKFKQAVRDGVRRRHVQQSLLAHFSLSGPSGPEARPLTFNGPRFRLILIVIARPILNSAPWDGPSVTIAFFKLHEGHLCLHSFQSGSHLAQFQSAAGNAIACSPVATDRSSKCQMA